MENKKESPVRMWKFQFSFIDFRLNALAGFALHLCWQAVGLILSLNWYTYLIVAIIASIKPLITFIKQM